MRYSYGFGKLINRYSIQQQGEVRMGNNTELDILKDV